METHDEEMDLLTFEEGLTGHPLSGEIYVCLNEQPSWLAEQTDLLDVEDGLAS